MEWKIEKDGMDNRKRWNGKCKTWNGKCKKQNKKAKINFIHYQISS